MKKRILLLVVAVAIPLALVALIVSKRLHKVEGSTVGGVLGEFELPQELEFASAGTNEIATIKLMGAKGIEELASMLGTQDSKQRLKAVWALGRVGSSASNAIPALIQVIDNSDPGVRYLSIRALTSLRVDSVELVPKLVARLNDQSPVVCNAAGELLNNIETERKTRNLPPTFANEAEYTLALLRSPSVRMQMMGIDRLATIREKDQRLLDALSLLKKSSVPPVQMKATSMHSYITTLP